MLVIFLRVRPAALSGMWILIDEHSKRSPLAHVRVALVKLFPPESSVCLLLFLRQFNTKLLTFTQHGAEHNLRRADIDEVEVAVIQNQRTAFSFGLPTFFAGFVDLSSVILEQKLLALPYVGTTWYRALFPPWLVGTTGSTCA